MYEKVICSRIILHYDHKTRKSAVWGTASIPAPGIGTLLKSIRRRNMAIHYKGAACARSVPRTLQNSKRILEVDRTIADLLP